MKSKQHKQQSSLLSFFSQKQPKASSSITSIAAKAKEQDEDVTVKAVSNQHETDDVINVDNCPQEDDKNDGNILTEPSSPIKDEKIVPSLDVSLVSPPDIHMTIMTRDETVVTQSKDNNFNDNITVPNECNDCSSSNDSGSESESEDESEDEQDNESTTKQDNNNEMPTKSPYELLRERNIERNNARLQMLGLLSSSSHSSATTAANTTTRTRKSVKRKKAVERVVSYPTRRSSRRKTSVRGGEKEDATETTNDSTTTQVVPMENNNDQVEETFVISALLEYDMNSSTTIVDGSSINPFAEFAYQKDANPHHHHHTTYKDSNESKILVPCGPRLIPPSGLNAIYSLQLYPDSPSWLVGAGKSGIVSLWNCSNNQPKTSDEYDDGGIHPVLSWKAHGGRWVADAKFLPVYPSSNSTVTSCTGSSVNRIPQRLLTAANDGTICHWDLTSHSVTTGSPKLLGRTDKSLHSSGIFSMDIRIEGNNDTVIASGSKDKTIAVSTIGRFGDAYWRSEFHSAKVGCVSLSSAGGIHPLIVSASDDGLVAVHDTRSNSVSMIVEDAHFKPHSAIWQPESDTVFLTAGLDTTIKLWDCRNASSPLASFHGHVPQSGKKMKRIHRPTFLSLGSESYILSGGEGSHSLSMFELSNRRGDRTLHSVFHRGKLPEDHGDAGSVAVLGDRVAVAGEGGEVLILSPKA